MAADIDITVKASEWLAYETRIAAMTADLAGARADIGVKLIIARRERDEARADLARVTAERDALRADSKRWKEMAEFQYAIRVYPHNLDLGIGALDEYFKGWTRGAAIDAARKEGS